LNKLYAEYLILVEQNEQQQISGIDLKPYSSDLDMLAKLAIIQETRPEIYEKFIIESDLRDALVKDIASNTPDLKDSE
jgi:hypothetical protein